ncbi:MAG: cobalt-precorrin-6A reductase [Paracoccaceae bacterium]|nr:cobalt-precorrin-6A reductase [Paracoccaceae bacterium]
MTANLLVLGGTTEASALAQALAERGVRACLSYAGRTQAPRAQPLPIRIGGFGGPDGLAQYLRENAITHLVDATHPFAAQMSGHAVLAAAATNVPLLAFERPAWRAEPDDSWHDVPDMAGAVAALRGPAERVFLALGRMHLAAFAAQPQHTYLLRLVDAPTAPLPLPNAHAIIARGPFDIQGDIALMKAHRITKLVAKNAGGHGAAAKIAAARALRLPIVMIARPAIAPRPTADSVDQVLAWLGHGASPRGV